MSPAALIVLGSLWVLFAWALSVGAAKLFKSLFAWPEYWCATIFVGLAAPIFTGFMMYLGMELPMNVSALQSFDRFSVSNITHVNSADTLIRVLLGLGLLVYIFGVYVHIFRTSTGWRRLQQAKNCAERRTIEGRTVFVTSSDIPPCAFGLLRPVILLPASLMAELKPPVLKLVLGHEVAHIRFYDPATMLCLLVIKALFWPHPAIHNLIGHWQFAAELRADSTVLVGENKKARREYGQLLVNVLRKFSVEKCPMGRKQKSKGALPCPSATLNLSNYRSAKMRVKNIMNQNHKPYKAKQLNIQLVALTFGVTILGSSGLIATASPAASLDRDAQPSVRFPPIFPVNCTSNVGKYAASVVVKFDVDKHGNVENIHVTKTDNTCFDQATIASVAKWKYQPVLQNGKPIKRKGVQTMVKYILQSGK